MTLKIRESLIDRGKFMSLSFEIPWSYTLNGKTVECSERKYFPEKRIWFEDLGKFLVKGGWTTVLRYDTQEAFLEAMLKIAKENNLDTIYYEMPRYDVWFPYTKQWFAERGISLKQAPVSH